MPRPSTGLAQMQGDWARAAALLEEGLAVARAREQKWTVAIVTNLLGHLARRQRDYAAAQTHYRASLPLFRAFNSPTYMAWCLEGYAAALSASEQSTRAVRLLAAAYLREQAGTPLRPSERADVEETVAATRAALRGANFEQEWTLGSGLAPDDIVAEALAA